MRVLLAEDQPKVRFALRVLLQRQPSIQIMGEAVNSDQLLDQSRQACPDLVLLAWGLPGQCMADLIAALHSQCPRLAVVALSGRPEAQHSALAAGADAFVSKGEPAAHLLATLAACCGDQGSTSPS